MSKKQKIYLVSILAGLIVLGLLWLFLFAGSDDNIVESKKITEIPSEEIKVNPIVTETLKAEVIE